MGEPTEMQVAIGHKGKRAYHVDVTGQSGHSALAPNFVSALHLAVDFVKELRALQTEIVNSVTGMNTTPFPTQLFMLERCTVDRHSILCQIKQRLKLRYDI